MSKSSIRVTKLFRHKAEMFVFFVFLPYLFLDKPLKSYLIAFCFTLSKKLWKKSIEHHWIKTLLKLIVLYFLIISATQTRWLHVVWKRHDTAVTMVTICCSWSHRSLWAEGLWSNTHLIQPKSVILHGSPGFCLHMYLMHYIALESILMFMFTTLSINKTTNALRKSLGQKVLSVN